MQAKLTGRSRSSYYYQHKKPAKDALLLERIREAHEEDPYLGYKRMADVLHINHKRVYRVMRAHGICSKGVRRKRGKNQYSVQKTSFPNLIKDMQIDSPNLVMAGDFTELRYDRRIYYLATVIDACTREVLGWHVATNHSVELVIEALRMALSKRTKAPLIFHSDHGSEYISERFMTFLNEKGIQSSHSQKGKPWQNGIQESFYHRFKQELGDLKRFPTIERLIEGLGQQFHRYNTKRIHSALHMPPRAFYEKKMQELDATITRTK